MQEHITSHNLLIHQSEKGLDRAVKNDRKLKTFVPAVQPIKIVKVSQDKENPELVTQKEVNCTQIFTIITVFHYKWKDLPLASLSIFFHFKGSCKYDFQGS